MAWMLQPHNWSQAVRPNLYNVAYRRNAAYKGMGQVEVTDLPITNPTYVARNFPTVEAATYGYPATGAFTTPPLTTATSNWIFWLVGGVLVLGLIAGGRR